MITHAYDGRVGVRYMTNGLKVYYLPMMILADQCTVPLVYGLFPMFRDVVVRERIEVVHGHQPTSSISASISMPRVGAYATTAECTALVERATTSQAALLSPSTAPMRARRRTASCVSQIPPYERTNG